jgi:predicted transcriptional regulator
MDLWKVACPLIVSVVFSCTCMYAHAMRTTIEIDEETHRRLREIAAARGERGFSRIVAEALAAYLSRQSDADEAVADALSAIGTLSADDAARMREAIDGWRDAWRS